MRAPHSPEGKKAGSAERRAEPPRAPAATPALQRARKEREVTFRGRELLERQSVLRGLILLAILVMVVSLWRAGLARAFVPGWWRQW